MEALAVGLLLLVLGHLWAGGLYLFKKIDNVEKKVDTLCATDKEMEERLAHVELKLDDHEMRLCNIEEES